MRTRQRLVALAHELGYSIHYRDERPIYYLAGGVGVNGETDYETRRIVIGLGDRHYDAITTDLRHELLHALGESVVPQNSVEVRQGSVCGNGPQPWWLGPVA